MNIVAAVCAFLFGCFLSYVNFLLTKKAIDKNSANVAVSFVIRQIINIGYLVLLYFLGKYFGLNFIYLIAGGALGITVLSFFFTSLLVKRINNGSRKGDDENG